ncbi:class I SAM-dependent methyltransferase [Nocardia sp. NPDC052254]|uniref:class I SAM-dependent methyltransferase n=1 Tax=Nocardia sp. NPDC052254 TaxID=3155681 RepID=UPI00341AF7B7
MTATGSGDTSFTGSIPEIYDALLVPMIFEEPALLLARTVTSTDAADILETAAGTGVLTRALARSGRHHIVATDLNEPMLTAAAARPGSAQVRWQVADAGQLPFPDRTFDVVTCQFGVMFLPDKVAGYAEALRVLRPGGMFAFNVWDRLENNAVTLVVTQALCATAPDEPLEFFDRKPHGYFDIDRIRSELEAAGFERITGEYLDGTSRTTAETAAIALCQGTPLRGEIERHSTLDLECATMIATDALRSRFGRETFDAPTRWLQLTAYRPDPGTAPDRGDRYRSGELGARWNPITGQEHR